MLPPTNNNDSYAAELQKEGAGEEDGSEVVEERNAEGDGPAGPHRQVTQPAARPHTVANLVAVAVLNVVLKYLILQHMTRVTRVQWLWLWLALVHPLSIVHRSVVRRSIVHWSVVR